METETSLVFDQRKAHIWTHDFPLCVFHLSVVYDYWPVRSLSTVCVWDLSLLSVVLCLSPTKGSVIYLLNSTLQGYGKATRNTFLFLQKSLTKFYKGEKLPYRLQLTHSSTQNHKQTSATCIHMLLPTFMGYLFCLSLLSTCWVLPANDYNAHIT